jgi:hypothetical protein
MGPEFTWDGNVPEHLYHKKHMPQIRVNLGFCYAADHVVEETADDVHTGMTGNAHFPTPPVPLADLLTATTAFSNARAEQSQTGKAGTAAKDNAREALLDVLRRLAAYVEEASDNDPAKLLSSGFEMVSRNRTSVELEKPHIIGVKNTGVGRLKLKVGTVKNARGWEIRHSTTPGVWVTAGYFNSSRDLELINLTPGTLYTIQVRALGGATGSSEWSDPTSHRSL